MDDQQAQVRRPRLAVTSPDYDEALRFYRDVLDLAEQASYSSPDDGRVPILEAGAANPRAGRPEYAAYTDQVEVGSGVAGHVRVAFEVEDTARVTATLASAGAEIICPGDTHSVDLAQRSTGRARQLRVTISPSGASPDDHWKRAHTSQPEWRALGGR